MECDKTGEPCHLRKVSLLPDNRLAWDLYADAQLEGVGPLIVELRQLTLTPFEADELADKLSSLGWIHVEIQEDVRKQKADERDMTARRKGQ